MAKKPLGTDSMGIQKTMRVGDYLGDCGGQFALNAMTGLVSAVLYFYTEKVGVAAATAANVLLAAKIVDAFTDLIMGKIMDNGKSPKGKCRPWFLRMAIPSFVAIVALFTVPTGLTGFAQVAYLFLSNVFLTAIVSTAVMIPYGAILVMRTKSLEERNKMGIFRAAAGYVIGMVIAIALVPLTNMLGSNGVADQAAYEICVGASVADIRLRAALTVDGVSLAAPDWQKGSWYETLQGLPTDAEFEKLCGSPLQSDPEPKKGAFTMEHSTMELKDISAVMMQMFKGTEATIAKSFGGKADYSDPTFKMMVMSGADAPLRAAVLSSCGMFPANLAEGMLALANGHPLNGVKKLIKK